MLYCSSPPTPCDEVRVRSFDDIRVWVKTFDDIRVRNL